VAKKLLVVKFPFPGAMGGGAAVRAALSYGGGGEQLHWAAPRGYATVSGRKLS